ncbi:WXG100 family type VII secretion target [Rhodococcus spongiicola]|uniref:Uncharacterized protein n=1 Tax=Rhodococcus spongiicola TaxID=2487352 RepID=A0A438AX06_9NOCA|nr:WXG100 family type VII secretion target [Rhodococcus spongiicola]RVW03192.1 hypothetical protein EF834_08415 [Rhodococcus spongiicola]
MSLTVSEVTGWTPESLRTTAEGIDAIVTGLDGQFDSVAAEQDALAETWHGAAATAAAERVVQEKSLGRAVAGALEEVAAQFREAAAIVDGARSHLVSVVADARARGFAVEDDGWVDPTGKVAWVVLAPEHSREAVRLRILQEAAELTLVVADALRQADESAVDAAARIQTAVDALQQAGLAATPGNVVDRGDGEFSWEPDWPATVAASTIGVMTDTTGKALTSAAAASADDVARTIGRGLGPFGAVIGTVPAIANDIEGGMDPAKAIVSEGAGTAVGVGVATGVGMVASYAVAGSAIGSVVPGAGTAAGLVVGAVFGAAATWVTSKGIQAVWD